MSGLFVTGTDTGCGKTAVACALARAAREAGLRVRVLKPVETGCEPDASGELVPADARALAKAAEDDGPPERICPYRLELPAAPTVAAAHAGARVELGPIVAAYEDARRSADLVLVEGAGGLRVPVIAAAPPASAPSGMGGTEGPGATTRGASGMEMGDLARHLDLPLIVVCRARLGTLNHTLLTLESAAHRGLRVTGVVVSHTEPELSAADRANLDALLAELPAPLLGELAFGASGLAPKLDVKALLSA